MTLYRTIVADPPWPQRMSGKYTKAKSTGGGNHKRPALLPYKTMSVEEIAAINVESLSDTGCHLWLWTTNQFLESGFQVMRAWGFKYLAPIHWVKPSGMGNYFVHRTQTILFGYRKTCLFPLRRYAPNVLMIPTDPKRHSEKPEEAFSFIESISPGPRLELFARRQRPGWDVWGNEVESDIVLTPTAKTVK